MSRSAGEWTDEDSETLRSLAESNEDYADAVAAYLTALEEVGDE